MPSWEGDYMKTIVQIMARLAEHNRVLYIDYEYTYKDVLFSIIGKSKAPSKRILGFEKRLREIKTNNNNVFVFTPPPVMPVNWIKDENKYNYWQQKQAHKVGNSINVALKQLHFNQPIVINAFNPMFGFPLLGAFNEVLSMYYCYDEIRAAAWAGTHGGRIEDEFLQKVDAVVVTSKGLLEQKKKLNNNCYLVKNGVDFELFNQGYNPKSIQQKEVKIGYIGSVDDRLDYDLLCYCFEQKPAWHFYFVGRIMYPKGEEILRKYSNVHLLGSRKPDQLPIEIAPFSACTIPFVTNEFTKNIYPLKINEYLAAGKPVVLSNFADLNEFEHIASICNNQVEFLNALELEVAHDSEAKQLQRIELARLNSWEQRVELLSDAIESMMKKKNA